MPRPDAAAAARPPSCNARRLGVAQAMLAEPQHAVRAVVAWSYLADCGGICGERGKRSVALGSS
eukprot:3972593-Pleurochrysis_carterae.AAC.3